MIENSSLLIFFFSLMLIQLTITTILIIRREDNIKAIKRLNEEINKLRNQLMNYEVFKLEEELINTINKGEGETANSRRQKKTLSKDLDKTPDTKEKENYIFLKEMKVGKKKLIEMNVDVLEVADVVIFGQITECESDTPMSGAVVKYFVTNPFTGELNDICHTFSGCDGYYMMRIPTTIELFNPAIAVFEEVSLEGETITIMAVGSDCPDKLESCECNE